MSFECRNAHSNPFFLRHEVNKLPDKIKMENCLFISKSSNFILPPIFSHWFTFSSDLHNNEASSSSKGFLRIKTVNTKKYGRKAMANNAISSWNNFQKIISSHVLRDLSHSKLKSLLVRHFLKSNSNYSSILQYRSNLFMLICIHMSIGIHLLLTIFINIK